MELLSVVKSVRPVAPYIGGKRNLAGRLTAMIDDIHCLTYAEPFVGMGGVFLRRKCRPRAEVINDISGDVSTFFRILQRHYVAFMDMLRFQLTTRSEFERLARTDPSTLTDLERAARFLYLQRTAFGGKVMGRNFGVSSHRPGRFDVTTLAVDLEALHERLAGVIIERLHYDKYIARYDRPETLFYLDPPYFGCEDDYGKEVFSRDEFARLSEQLSNIAGQFILSINDTPEVREIFSAHKIETIETTYSVSSVGTQKVGELIISKREPVGAGTAGAVGRFA